MQITQTRAQIQQAIEKDLATGFRHFPYDTAQSLALGSHLLASEGHSHSLLGQVSARADGDAGTFLGIPFGLGLDEADADNLVHFDRDLKPLGGPHLVHPGMRFHLWIYDQRPDVRAIVHTHPPHAVALGMTCQTLRPLSMDAAMLYDDVAYLDHWPGTPEGDEEGRIISSALGDKSSILLCNHGLLTVGRTVQQAMYLAVFFERAAAAQLLASATGPLKEVSAEAAQSGHGAMTRDTYVNATMAYLFRKTARRVTDTSHIS